LRLQYLCVVSSRYFIPEVFCMLDDRLADAALCFTSYYFKLRHLLDCLSVIISDYKCLIANEPIFAYYTHSIPAPVWKETTHV
jgi:hypothetical protein